MNIEDIRNYCLAKPLATEDSAFGPDGILFRVYNKIFAYIDLDRPDLVVTKCDPDYALELRESHPEITGAWHMNKKHWNQINLYGLLADDFIQSLIRHSYDLVVRKLPKKTRKLWNI